MVGGSRVSPFGFWVAGIGVGELMLVDVWWLWVYCWWLSPFGLRQYDLGVVWWSKITKFWLSWSTWSVFVDESFLFSFSFLFWGSLEFLGSKSYWVGLGL